MTDGESAYTFYSYGPEEMNIQSASLFIGLLINGKADGFSNSKDGSYLRRPDENLILETEGKGKILDELQTCVVSHLLGVEFLRHFKKY